jgi:predicted nucleotidyltransferase
MIALVDDKRSEIAALCRRFGIRRLEIFGSGATGRFNPAMSDLDFVVDLGDYDETVGDRYFDFADALEELLGRPVDLLTERSIRNPYLKAAVNRQRRTVYEAGDRETAA